MELWLSKVEAARLQSREDAEAEEPSPELKPYKKGFWPFRTTVDPMADRTRSILADLEAVAEGRPDASATHAEGRAPRPSNVVSPSRAAGESGQKDNRMGTAAYQAAALHIGPAAGTPAVASMPSKDGLGAEVVDAAYRPGGGGKRRLRGRGRASLGLWSQGAQAEGQILPAPTPSANPHNLALELVMSRGHDVLTVLLKNDGPGPICVDTDYTRPRRG